MTEQLRLDDFPNECVDCIHYKCYDDGDNRWDIWCSKNKEQKGDDEFNIHLAETCPHYKEDEGLRH